MAPPLKFNRGDKVFAKVRGYPPWPARVDGCADETPNKMKYHVYFYGTGETAVVKVQDVFTFVENKSKYGKLKKHKNFTEAMQQIEAELSPEQKAALLAMESDKTTSPAVKEKESPGNVKDGVDTPVSDSNKSRDLKSSSSVADPSEITTPVHAPSRRTSTTTKTPKSSTPTAIAKSTVKDIKHKLESEPSPDEPAPKTPNIGVQPTPEKGNDDKPSAKLSEGISRSGRRIKPKKFTDYEEDPRDLPTKDDDKKIKEARKPGPRSKSLKGVEETNDTEPSGWYLIARGKDTIKKIPTNLNRPNFEDNKARSMSASEWDNLILDEARALKKRIELCTDELTDAEIVDYMERYTKFKADSIYIIRSPEEQEEFRRVTLDIEGVILDIEIQIRDSVSLKKADPKKCLQCLDRLKGLRITALMLKKHPELVHSLQKLQRYIGNVGCWDMTDGQIREFNVQADKIRKKAEEVVNCFQTLFFLPPSVSFWDHFSDEHAKFTARTEHMTMDEFMSIVTEPE